MAARVRPAPWSVIREGERFAAECLQPMEDQWVSVEAVYTAWTKWLAEQDIENLPMLEPQTLAKIFRRTSYRLSKRYNRGRQRRVILGAWPRRGDLFSEELF